MSTITTTTMTAPARARVRAAIASLVDAVRRQGVRSWTRHALAGLPDEALRDIGVTRCEIGYVAARAAEAPAGLSLPQARQ